MNVVELRTENGLAGGYYTVAEAARLLHIPQSRQGTLRNWLSDQEGRAGAVILRQYPRSASELGFYDLLEVRFIDYFRRQGVSLQSIRKAAVRARREMQARHPFAMSNLQFVTDRKKVFAVSAEETGDKRLMELVHGQYEMYEVIEDYLAKGIVFRPDGLARLWHPEPRQFPKITISPKVAHGQPVVSPAKVPTRALFDLWLAEKRNTAAVADWYEVAEGDVEQAVEYELDLAA